jgi:hypothetical protein
LERQLLDTFPTVLATQQRSRHFARVIQAHIRDNVRLASCPSGLMRDLLARDYRGRASGSAFIVTFQNVIEPVVVKIEGGSS